MRCLFSPTDAAAVEEEDSSATISPRDPASPSQSAVKAGTYVIIGVIVAVLIFIALVIDVSCYFVNKRGKHFFFFFFFVRAPLVNHYTVVWTNSSPTGMWRHFYVVTTVVTATTTTIPLCVCRLLRAVDSFFVVAFPRASCMSLRDQTSSIFVFGFARLFPLTSIFMAHAIIKKRRGKKMPPRSGNFVVE